MKTNNLAKKALRDGATYLYRHRTLLALFLKQAIKKQVLVPLDAIRWILSQLLNQQETVRISKITSVNGGLRIQATLSVMGTFVEIKGTIFVKQITLTPEKAWVALHLHDLTIEPSSSILAGVVGLVDLQKPANLMAFLPSIPALVSATNEEFVFDFWQLPAIQKHPRIKKTIGIFGLLCPLAAVRFYEDFMILQYR